MQTKRFVFFILLVSFFPFIHLTAQNNVIDEVIWIVGDDAILKSEVEEQRLRAQYEGVPIQGDPYCVIPEQIAIQKLFLHQAQLDSIVANESTVNSQVEARLNYFVSQIGSKEKMEEYFGKKTTELREDLRQIIREQMIIQQMQQKLVGDINPTPAEVRRFFKQLPEDSIPVVPAQVELQIISYQPPVSQQEINRVKQRLLDFTERINSGNADFSVLARLYSEDVESAKRGGELGFLGRGQLVPEFAAVAFNLQDPKKVSRIVETEFGFHIIQLIEKRGDRINCRHILLRPRISEEEKEKALHTMDSIANLIRSGKITFEQAVMYYSQDKNTALNAGLMLNEKTGTSKFEYQDLPPEISKIAYNMNVGEISNPFIMIDPKTHKEVIAIVKVKSKIPNHKANLVDDYQLIKTFYENKKKEEFLRDWIIKKQKETYISIDPAWRNCEFQYPGWIKN
ncbi:MAG TPA: peptidylprolyl isomerase [Paludibacteraceae bacterium]|nr:peptidylprolyl isomerase [Paludibacteraceae bacterium]OPZ01969.1 MAG: Chaperone SurA precursor [Bacteroidetes bacterium ADurb.BinA395]HOJ66955.1 peptidylprolyl isomerase [Paludibacteraceae bacterium]HOL29500.1 peptidylprolyl isomerase [Paludibacteraceae bacterium]HON02787.1 peptidylprolyl isomerase [Paludibacteraceae bacterium]